MQRPNILLVMADQLAPHHTGAYGHPLVQTPAMNAMVERGMRFDATYCHSPLCAPARFTMLSGQPVSAIGAWDNAAEFPASVPTLAHHLRLAGYRTTLSGKMHFVGPDQLHGFDERLTTDIYPADFAWTPRWDAPHERIDQWYHNMDVVHEAGRVATTYQLDYDEEVGFTTRRKLYDLARSADDRPFFLTASFIHPHDPYDARPEWWDLYADDDIDLPETIADADLDPHTRRIRAAIEADVTDTTEQQIRNARHGYYANVSYVDSWLGQLIDVLTETKQIDNTIVIFTSDHGDMLGDRGAWFKMSFHERSARVPLIISGPGIAQGVATNVNSHLDLLPTLLDIATDGNAANTISELPGRSLLPLATGGVDDVDETTGEYMGEASIHPMFMIRRGALKYIHCDVDPPLLYDVEADPMERTNLAADPVHEALAAAFAIEAQQRWDSDAIRQRVLASQRARHLVNAATEVGPLQSWDHAPVQDVANQYVRNTSDWTDSSARSRFPLP